jgi:beta-lactam-binding protein with PASTA domain
LASNSVRVFVSILALVVVAVLILASTHSTNSDSPTTTNTTAAQSVQVPQLVGLPQSAAQTLLHSEGLTFTVSLVSGPGAAGSVLSQEPAAGSSVATGTKMILTVAAGGSLPTIPNVAGQTSAQAKATLAAAGFPVKSQTQAHSDYADGDVVSTVPAAGTAVPANSSVELVISEGPAKGAAPPRRVVTKPTPTTRPPSTPTTRPAPPTTTPPTSPPTTTPPTTTPTTLP